MIPHNQPTLGEGERQAALRVLASGWVAQGREVEAFENEVCEYLGLAPGQGVALSSGTAALFMALWVLGAQGKRVAIPVYSCAALRNAVLMAGGEPVAIDTAEHSPNIDLQQAGSSGADLIVAAHMFGMPARWSGGDSHVPIIEDCAQAFGARIDGRPVGLNGTAAVLSFYATKMLTSGGQGGMVVSADTSLVEAVRDYREFDCRRDRKARFNLQMTDLQAAVGRAQLAQLDRFIRMRTETHRRYAAAGLPLWAVAPGLGVEPCHYRAIIRHAKPDALIAGFERRGVRAINPIADWELLADAEAFPRALALTRSAVSIPIHPSLTQEQITHVANAASQLLASGELSA